MALANRSLKPYAPVGIAFVDTSDPGGTGQVAVTWNNRNRLTSGIKKQSAASDTLEDGQEHTIRVYAHDGTTLLRTVTGLTGTSYNYTAAFEIADAGGLEASLTFKIKSTRDGYESYEAVRRMTNRLFYVIDGSDDVAEGAELVIA